MLHSFIGKPECMFRNNGSNFVRADKELRTKFNSRWASPVTNRLFRNRDITPPRAFYMKVSGKDRSVW